MENRKYTKMRNHNSCKKRKTKKKNWKESNNEKAFQKKPVKEAEEKRKTGIKKKAKSLRSGETSTDQKMDGKPETSKNPQKQNSEEAKYSREEW